jgi:thioredoxin 1
MATTNLTAENFESTITGNGIVLVDFWAEWCGPCRAFGPVFEKVSEANTDIVFGKVDTEAEPALAGSFGITSIPTLMIFREEVLVYSQPGALPEQSLVQIVEAVRNLDMEEVRAQIAEQDKAPAGTN